MTRLSQVSRVALGLYVSVVLATVGCSEQPGGLPPGVDNRFDQVLPETVQLGEVAAAVAAASPDPWGRAYAVELRAAKPTATTNILAVELRLCSSGADGLVNNADDLHGQWRTRLLRSSEGFRVIEQRIYSEADLTFVSLGLAVDLASGTNSPMPIVGLDGTKDPWGQDIVVVPMSVDGAAGAIFVASAGPDRNINTTDDFIAVADADTGNVIWSGRGSSTVLADLLGVQADER